MNKLNIGNIVRKGRGKNGRGFKYMRVLDDFGLLYISAGEGFYEEHEGVQLQFQGGDLIYLEPGRAHRYYTNEASWGESWVLFNGPVFELLEESGLLPFGEGPIVRLEPANYWKKRFEETVFEQAVSEEMAVSRLQLFITEVKAHVSQSKTHEQHWLNHAYSLLSQPKVELDYAQVSRELKVSYEVFRKRFKQLAGMPPSRYHAQCLGERACDLLINGELSNQEIADQLGYCDAFHFSKNFKRTIGVSPREFRKRYFFDY